VLRRELDLFCNHGEIIRLGVESLLGIDQAIIECLETTEARKCEHVAIICSHRAAIGCLKGLVKWVVRYAEACQTWEDVRQLVDESPGGDLVEGEINLGQRRRKYWHRHAQIVGLRDLVRFED